MQKYIKIAYEIIMILLVMLTIISIWTEDSVNTTINWVVWAVFTIDFFSRLYMAESKWSFLKQNPFLVIAIIPFDHLFQVARIVRLIYLFRIKTITKYYVSPYIDRLSYRSMTVVISSIIIMLFFESIVIMNIESSIVTIMDALYVTFGHLLFFGREIFVITQSFSIWSLTATSIMGVILQGLALQWAFSKLDNVYKKVKKTEVDSETK
ncbi:transporter [Oceanobacillus halophilus]|uniref:Transporter n=1 Tax=Oceanobacillus halophilus TaxID=930130 RepID=A0A495A1P9_9BACI|nr:transporter [Oceanobacillus halophilus]RKQ32965.1 transporter [Oceanobacillus halophilus]